MALPERAGMLIEAGPTGTGKSSAGAARGQAQPAGKIQDCLCVGGVGGRRAVFHLTQGRELLPLLRVWGAECIQKGRNINLSTNVAVLVQMDPAGLSSLMGKSLACP